jgi:hypothetical protein
MSSRRKMGTRNKLVPLVPVARDLCLAGGATTLDGHNDTTPKPKMLGLSESALRL